VQCGAIDNAKTFFEKKKKTEIKETYFKSLDKNIRKPMGSRDRKGDSKGDPEENLEVKEITGYEGDVLEKLSETFNAGLANRQRIIMLDYCLTERSFSDIMLTLRLNPASLKHHGDLLQENGLIKKTGESKNTRYKTTHLGETLLRFVEDVRKAIRTT